MITNEMYEQQTGLEMEMRGLGIDRLRGQITKAREHGRESRTAYGSHLLASCIEPLGQAISKWIESNSAKAGRRHIALKYLRMIEPEVAAYITARCVVDQLTFREASYQKKALSVGRRIEDEVRFRAFEDKAKELNQPHKFERAKEKATKGTTYRYKSVVMVHSMNKLGVEWEAWPEKDLLSIGTLLIEQFCAVTGYAERVLAFDSSEFAKTKDMARQNQHYRLVATDKVLRAIEKLTARAEEMCPVYMPTIIPPKPWTSARDGGYYTHAVPQLPIIKTRNKGYLEELDNRAEQLQPVFDAVNALQNTAWRVNQPVYEVFKTLWENHVAVAGLPERDPRQLPPKPDLDFSDEARANWTEEQKAEWGRWKKAASEVHEWNITIKSHRIQLMKILWMAERMSQYPRFYYPYQLDFRGRAYTIPGFLQPQGSDIAKGLLTFAEGKAITKQDQADWLAIHGANVWGYDKADLADRVKWVEERTEMITAIAESPLDHMEWTEADKPAQFLAFCFEWAAFKRRGFGYVCSLPVAMDGSCNGLQIFSLVLRDPVGAAATNCTPSATGKPQDIYQLVANKVIEKLKYDVAHGGEVQNKAGKIMYDSRVLAGQWLQFGIDRKCTKRPVMVLPYGGQKFSMREYVADYVKERMTKGDQPGFADNLNMACIYLTDLIWDAIGLTVTAARECMDWLQSAARVAAKEELPIHWTTPDGFPVLQAYDATKERRIETKIGDSILKLTLHEPTGKLDKSRQANGISPNWVHSLDGCALRMSVNRAVKKDVRHFAMVHDSYGVMPTDAPVMAQCLREAFVDMCTSTDVLEDFKQSLSALLSEEQRGNLKPLPSKGTLDITAVLDSVFFFA